MTNRSMATDSQDLARLRRRFQGRILLPDEDGYHQARRVWNAMVDRRPAVIAPLRQRDGIRYRVDRELFAVDLWRFQAAMATARRAELDPAVVGALAEAGDAYGGPLLDGALFAWVEGPREDLRRRAVDALARLSELRQAGGIRRGRWWRWSRRSALIRWPRSCTGGSCDSRLALAGRTRSGGPIGCWPAVWLSWTSIPTRKPSSWSPTSCVEPVPDPIIAKTGQARAG